jgi:flagellar hook-associated protein FlgK
VTGLGINIGLNALLGAQSKLETIGHNLSNASTPGYSRQTLHVSTSTPLRLRGLLQGTGMQADTITRTVDALLHGRITSQVASLGRIDTHLEIVSNVENFLRGSNDAGAPAVLKQLFQSFAALSTAPEDTVLRTGAVQASISMASTLNQLASNTQTLSRDTFLRLRGNLETVNSLAREIGDLNRHIVDSEFGTATANDLRDAREQTIKELAQYVDVRSIEDGRGAVRVLVGGQILVSPTTVESIEITGNPGTGDIALEIDGQDVVVTGGAIGALLAVQKSFLPGFQNQFDAFARNLILETNRVHSTGVPRGGSFRSLVATNRLADQNLDGNATNELLSRAGLPFDVVSGDLYVNMVDTTSGALTKHKITVDAARTTAQQFADALDGIPNLSSSFDAQGRLQIIADAGYSFDFSPRLDDAPDELSSFGGGRASIATGFGPFALTPGDTLDFVGPSSSFSVAFATSNFTQIGAARAHEIAAVLNADPNFQANGLRASALGETLVVQTSGSGASQTFQVAGGSALGALGWSAGTTLFGADSDVAPRISGTYVGADNDRWTFRPNMDGTIGTTPGLLVEVFDSAGTKIADIDVGPGYTPGDEIEVLDGVRVAFGFGDLSQSNGDLFELDVVADSDTTDALVALGLNALFTGHDAQTIAVRSELVQDPGLLAASLSGAPGDGGNLVRLLQVESTNVDALGQASLDEYLSDVVSSLALDIDTSKSARDAEQFLLDGLEARRDQDSGVNTDEELVRMIEQEQAYGTAAQYLRVISEMTNELMSIL